MIKQTVYQLSDKEFIQFVNESLNIRQALLTLKIGDSAYAYRIFKERCEKLHIMPSQRGILKRTDTPLRKLLSNEIIISACLSNISRQSTLRCLGLNDSNGTNIKWINKFILDKNPDISHWLGQGHLKNKTHNWGAKFPLEEILIQNSQYISSKLGKRLVKEQILENKCYKCGVFIWQDVELSLHLHHINGDHSDNRIENLQLLCPNCHSITKNYCGKNISKPKQLTINNNQLEFYFVHTKASQKIKQLKLCSCGKEINKNSISMCEACHYKSLEKIIWPENDELVKMVKESNYSAAAKVLGVSDQAIRHRLLTRGINLPKTKYSWKEEFKKE